MVLLIAALYTLYQKARARRRQQQEATASAPDTTSPQQQQDPPKQTDPSIQLFHTAFEQLMQCTAVNHLHHDDDDAAGFLGDRDGVVMKDDDLYGSASTATSRRQPQQQNAVETFCPAVRREWWNAVYGPDFLDSSSCTGKEDGKCFAHFPHHGTGLSGIRYFSAYEVTIPVSQTGNKVGVTISRLPLGLYVRSVQPGSEAALAGIPVKSVLVSINGIPLLAEPSRYALERLWLYEGYFGAAGSSSDESPAFAAISAFPTTTDELKLNTPTNTTATPATDDAARMVREPVVLQLIHRGKLFTVTLLSNPPWGITWAPCGNFPLIKRVYSFAADAGVQKGSLVAAVNDRSVRDMDHEDTALYLRELFENQQQIHLVCSYPPAAARSNEKQQRKLLPAAKVTSKTRDGVEVKFHPLEYAIGSLCLGGNSRLLHSKSIESELHVLAERAAAGQVVNVSAEADGVVMQQQSASAAAVALRYGSCPSYWDDLLEHWDPLDSLIYCVGFQEAGFDHLHFRPLSCDATRADKIERLKQLICSPTGPVAAYSFVLQFISIICSPEQYANKTSEQDEKKSDESQHSVTMSTSGSELTAMLLKLSRRDDGFCQYLYFLLRSFISTFETRRPSTGGDRNLMALLHCLELLRFAEKELASRPLTGKPSNLRSTVAPPSPSRKLPLSPPHLMFATQWPAEIYPTAPPSPMAPASPGSPESQEETPEKRRGVLGFFRKKKQTKKTPPIRKEASPQPPKVVRPTQTKSSSDTQVTKSLSQSPSTMYENMSDFLSELDRTCATIERSLQKSFRQKIAEWALQPWSATKDSALAEVTKSMRDSLRQANEGSSRMLLVNPVDSTELLSSVDYDECYILPSAHFPILLTFNVSERRSSDSVIGEEMLYRTTVELDSLKCNSATGNSRFVVHGAIAGTVVPSGETETIEDETHVWNGDNVLIFETRSSWGAPQTLSLRLCANAELIDPNTSIHSPSEIGFGWVDLSDQWFECEEKFRPVSATLKATIWPLDSEESNFDDNGQPPKELLNESGLFELKVRIKTESVECDSSEIGSQSRKRMLLYKHDDDLRQEAFAVQFIRTCDDILKASGLDMMLLTFQCIPVGTRRGFVEWVPGSVPLSEICQPFAGSLLAGSNAIKRDVSPDDDGIPSMVSKAGLSKFESLRRLQQNETLHRLAGSRQAPRGCMANNPVQDYLRSVAYDHDAPYLIKRDVMDTYVKSCAGYSVITYILGVGDRHLDNLLLHQSGSFFHCDFSFILGNDPKKYLPMRITEDMVHGMGGRESDNFAKFLSLACAAFLALRHPENVRVLLSMVRLMETALLPDLSENQTIKEAILGVRNRLRLDLSEKQALAYMEDLIESSLSSKMWLAVDAIHTLGKKIR